MSLEAELGRPDSEKKRLDADDAKDDSRVSATPVMFVAGQRGEEVPLGLDKLDFSGPPHVALETGPEDKLPAPTAPRYVTEPMQVPLAEETSDTSSDDAENSSSWVTSFNNTPRGGSAAINVAKKTKKTQFKRIRKTPTMTPTRQAPPTVIPSNVSLTSKTALHVIAPDSIQRQRLISPRIWPFVLPGIGIRWWVIL